MGEGRDIKKIPMTINDLDLRRNECESQDSYKEYPQCCMFLV